MDKLTPEQEKRQIAAAIRRLTRLQLNDAFDSARPTSRPTDKQLEIMKDINAFKHRYVRAGNQGGKSSIGAREVAWIFEDNHPYWERPKEWENESLLLIVVGRLGNQIENSLWPKIKGFLDPGTYKEQRSGSALQRVINTKNGNVILFASHHSENEAREKLQSYVAHYAWLDEMPGNSGIIEELHRRVQARNGYFLATFTPKVKNEDIRRFVDSQVPPLAQTYRLQMFDNPLYSPERQEEILASLQGKGTSEKNAILYGDWMEDDNTVYQLNRDSTVVTSLPTSYSPGWRHVESVDPALKSKFGFLLLAEDPATAKWYVVQSSYISGVFVPEHMIAEVRKKAAGYNIVRRISDNEPWFVNSAVHQQLKPAYMQVFNKTQRKGDLIKNLQTALGTKIFIPIWNEDLILELESARWKETSETIQNSQDMHLSDALQYAVDILPPPVFTPEARPYHQILRDNHEKAYIQKVVDEKTKANKLPSHVKQFKIKKVGTRWK